MTIVKNYLRTQFYFDVIVILIVLIPLIYDSYDIDYIQLIPVVLLWIKKTKYSRQLKAILQYHPWTKITYTMI